MGVLGLTGLSVSPSAAVALKHTLESGRLIPHGTLVQKCSSSSTSFAFHMNLSIAMLVCTKHLGWPRKGSSALSSFQEGHWEASAGVPLGHTPKWILLKPL